MKRTEPLQIGRIVEQMLEADGTTALYNEQRLIFLWPEIVGRSINRLTTRRYIDRGTLHVYITSSVLKNELSFQRQALVDALNRAVGATVITDIQIH